MNLEKLAWAAWALVPVAALAYHFGPGQAVYQHDRACQLQKRALTFETEALVLHEKAYEVHLKSVEARRIAAEQLTLENEARATRAAEEESRAFKMASDAWRLAAEAFSAIEQASENALPETRLAIRWSRCRALVRAGDIWNGISGLEGILTDIESNSASNDEFVRATREELASAYYYAARLMRLSGEPAEEWLIESGKARQHFRYLAEDARAGNVGEQLVTNYERNVERVLDLEQSSLLDIQGKPLPEDSPLGRRGNRPGRTGRTQRPPDRRDGRGAGGARDIHEGW